jgi:mannose-1-phosphate guanylyltransferase
VSTVIPVILSGGSGSRLWPLSREMYPKQLLALTGPKTMLQDTLERVAGIPGAGAPIIVCNEAHRFMVAEQIRALPMSAAAIILEPVGRNTAPAVALAALQALQLDPLAVARRPRYPRCKSVSQGGRSRAGAGRGGQTRHVRDRCLRA